MKRIALALFVALVVVGVAAAGRMDPKEDFKPADQARAKAMVLRKGDLPPAYKATKSSLEPFSGYCKAADESDLTITGRALSPDFDQETMSAVSSVASQAQLYKTVTQANTSWSRFSSPAGLKCLEVLTRNALKGQGVTLVSQRKIPFPKVAPKTLAVRQVLASEGVKLTTDYVVLQNGRAHAYVYFLGAPAPFSKAEEIRLAKVTAGRLATALRGA